MLLVEIDVLPRDRMSHKFHIGLKWMTPKLTEIAYTEVLKRLYRCEMAAA